MKMHINVTGRVQGVGFRYTTYQMAVEIGLTGTVKNEDDGSVTIEAVGTKEQITEFLGKVKQPKIPSPKFRILNNTKTLPLKTMISSMSSIKKLTRFPYFLRIRLKSLVLSSIVFPV